MGKFYADQYQSHCPISYHDEADGASLQLGLQLLLLFGES